ncbi:MAG: hypothetical protein E7510_13650 [Ruminococcus sp.]|nr:hypothetical protein [Ruminococcus sp.]
MKKRMKKVLFTFATIASLATNAVAFTASAESNTSIFHSRACTAGNWWSGYDNNDIHSVTASGSNIYGGDVQLYFHSTTVGLPNSFVKSTSRTADFELKEDDASSNNENEIARKITGHFSVSNAGYYQITILSYPYTNPACIESNNVAELYMRMKINRVSGDTSANVPYGLVRYQFHAD